MYPAFVNCTTIDWFSEWPEDALLEVADKYLENMEFANEEEVRSLLFFISNFGQKLLIYVFFQYDSFNQL